MRIRTDNHGNTPLAGLEVDDFRQGLSSAQASIRTTSPLNARASISSGTCRASSAKGGASSLTRSSNTNGAWPSNCLW
jgi:hypothetical protein